METLQDFLDPYIDRCTACLQDPSKTDLHSQAQIQLDFCNGLLSGKFVQHIPSDFFVSEQLSAGHALLALAGIDPRESHGVDWAADPYPKIKACRFLNEGLFFGFFYSDQRDIPRKELRENIQEKVKEFWESLFTNQNLHRLDSSSFGVAIRHELFVFAQANLNQLFWLWRTRQNATEGKFNRYELHEVSYYIEWIKRTGAEEFVPWWDNAVKSKILPNSSDTYGISNFGETKEQPTPINSEAEDIYQREISFLKLKLKQKQQDLEALQEQASERESELQKFKADNEELLQQRDNLKQLLIRSTAPQYLDKSLLQYSPEITAVIETWEYIFRMYPDTSHPRKEAIAFLEQNRDKYKNRKNNEELTQKAINRIATVVNWLPSGGR